MRSGAWGIQGEVKGSKGRQEADLSNLEIRIPTIPSEGFEWIVDKLDTKILTQVGDAEYVADDGVNATGGIVILKFKAIGKGETNLSLLYASAASADRPGLSKNSFGMFVEVK